MDALWILICLMAAASGYLLAMRSHEWMVTEAREAMYEANRQAAEARKLDETMNRVAGSLTSMAEILQSQRKSIDTLDFNVGQLHLRAVKEQVRVKGLQHGEEMGEAERLSGLRRTIEPLPQPDEPNIEGFTIDGTVVDPRKGLQRTIASAQPT